MTSSVVKSVGFVQLQNATSVVGKKAYLAETWNRLDMFIVVAGFVMFFRLPFVTCHLVHAGPVHAMNVAYRSRACPSVCLSHRGI